MTGRLRPDGSSSRPWRPAVLVIAPLLLVVLIGAILLGSWGPHQSTARPGTGAATQLPPPASVPTTIPTSTPSEVSVEPKLVRWGGHGTRLAMVVRNPSSVEIQHARVLVTVLDAQGNPLGTRAAPPGAKCCTVLGLAPGGEFGLFANLGIPVSRIDRVLLRFLDVTTAPVADRAPKVLVSDPVLSRTRSDTVVTATLTASGDVGPLVAGQAFLTDPDGRLVAVISGRFYCFADQARRRLRMQLLHTVPPDTRIQRVLAHPIPADVSAITPRACT